jgi:hypothetical protein
MSIPAWLLDVFVAVMLLVAAISAAQLVAGCPSRWAHVDADITASHLLMGVAMAGMLVASLQTLPNAAWEVIFAVMTVWFAWSAWRRARGAGLGALAGGHYAPHLVHSAAMLYMYLALAAPAKGSGMAGMAGMGGTGGMGNLRLPVLAFLFILLLAGYTVRDLDRWAGSDGYFHVLRHDVASAAPASASASASASATATATAGPAPVPPPPASGATAGGGLATVAQPEADRDAAPAITAHDGAAALIFAPGVVKACRVAMGVTMAFMLVIMI